MTISLEPIGVVRSPFAEPQGMPIQASVSRAIGSIEILPAYVEGLLDLDGFDHILVIYRFHLSKSEPLIVEPFLDSARHGVFATRAPMRPNRLGISILRLTRVNGAVLDVENVDMVDGTPILDIKPYVPAFDVREGGRVGWFADRLAKLDGVVADDRMLR